MTGVLLSVPPADFVLHNSLFLVAHFHNVIIGGVLFGAFAGYEYWFPKACGFKLHEGLGKAAFWFWTAGFYVAFVPLYVLGLMGMTRRMQHYDVPAWHPWLVVAAFGAVLILIGIVLQVVQLVVSIRNRDRLRDATGDPWNGRSLEWATASPPPLFNFAVLPIVKGAEAHWERKRSRAMEGAVEPQYREIHMPRNSATGFVCAFFATVMGFALIWHIWWLVAVAFVCAYATFVVLAWRDVDEVTIPAERIAEEDRAHRRGGVRRHGAGRSRGMNTAAMDWTAHAGKVVGRPRSGLVEAIVVGYGFWLFLISDIIVFGRILRVVCGADARHRGRPERARRIQRDDRRDRDRLSPDLDHVLRDRRHRWRMRAGRDCSTPAWP